MGPEGVLSNDADQFTPGIGLEMKGNRRWKGPVGGSQELPWTTGHQNNRNLWEGEMW